MGPRSEQLFSTQSLTQVKYLIWFFCWLAKLEDYVGLLIIYQGLYCEPPLNKLPNQTWKQGILVKQLYGEKRRKLDGVAPLMTDPPPISSTTLSEKKNKKIKKMWYVTRDMWHVTRDTWHVTRDMWHVTHDTFGGGEHSLKISAP